MNRPVYRRTMGVLCLCTLATILVAGLWPFHAPENDVAWLAQENGLRLGVHGTLVSAGAFGAQGNNGSGSFEIWIEPARPKGRSTILAFADSGPTPAPVMLQQSRDKLIIQRRNTDDQGTARTAEMVIAGALSEGTRRLVTVTLGPHTTSVYLDGVLAKMSEIQGSSTGTLSGRLVLGNSVTASDSWSGEIMGLAIYGQELTQQRVLQSYQDWSQYHRPVPGEDEQPRAVYLFGERDGKVAGNPLDRSTDLIIPARYLVLQSPFLEMPWRHYHTTWSYWADAAVNVAGFIPFGYLLVAFFSTVRATTAVAVAAVVLGFLTSLTIESLQAYLPTRDSGVNDLITNTIGTLLGVLLYRSLLFQNLLRRLFATQLQT
jgi:VanZ family protein